MKILYISPENTVGTLSTWKRFHESQNNQCDFITFYKSPNNFESGICLNLPFISTGWIYKKMRSIYYRYKYGKGGEHKIKEGTPPTWRATKAYERLHFKLRDYFWSKIIDKKLRNVDLLGFDIYHFEWGLDFYRDCSFAKKVSNLNKPIICTYHGQDLRTRGVIEPLNSISDKNFSSELDLLSMHPKMEYMFLPIELSQKNPLKKTGEKIRICHTPTNRYYKGSKKIIDVCSQIANENNNVEFILIEKAEHEKVLKIKKTCDILIDQIGNRGGIGYGMNSVESMALGLCCMTEMTDECNAFFKDHPFINVNENSLKQELTSLINDRPKIDVYKKKSLDWIKKNHDICVVGKKLYSNYQKMLNGK